MGPRLTQMCQGLRRARPGPAVAILEPHDVVQLGRRDLEDRRVLERRDPVDRARAEMEARPRSDHLGIEDGLPGFRSEERRVGKVCSGGWRAYGVGTKSV